MADKSILAGGVLIVVGLVITVASGSGSVTSLIPAFFGLVLVALGALGRFKPDLNHHAMHAAAGFSLLALLGSVGSAVGRGSTGWALTAQVATIVVTAAFLVMAVQSFRAARLARGSSAA